MMKLIPVNLSSNERELPVADIYEPMDFEDETLNETLKTLQKELLSKVWSRPGSVETESLILSYNKLGVAYYRLHLLGKAEICFYRQLELSRPELVNIPSQKPRVANRNEEKNALINLASIYHMRRLYELALQTNKMALDIAEELEDRASQAKIFNNMANIYEHVYDIDSAFESHSKCMEIVTDLADVNGQIKSAAALGSLCQLKGQIRDSILYYGKAIINLRMKIVKKQIEELESK